MGEQIAAEQRGGALVEQHAGIPPVRDVRRVDPAQAPPADLQHLAIREHARRAIGDIIERDHHAGLAMRGLGLWRDGEPFVERPAVVRLVVAEADPAQPLRRDDAREQEHPPKTGLEQQRLVAQHQELV